MMANGNDLFMTMISGIGSFFGIAIWKHEGDIRQLKTEMIIFHKTNEENNVLLKKIAGKMKIEE